MNIFKLLFMLLTFGGLLIIIIILFAWIQISYDYIPNLIEIKDAAKKEYDFIIVGAGTSGSVLANKLSANNNFTVLLIEAGNQFGLLSTIPLLSTMMQNTKVDWCFMSAKQKYAFKGMVNQQQYLPMGKGLGGSSQLNFMLHTKGIQNDFDNWERIGGKEWSFIALKPYINRFDDDSTDQDKLTDEKNYCPNDEYSFQNECLQRTIGCTKSNLNKNDLNDYLTIDQNVNEITKPFIKRITIDENPLTKILWNAAIEYEKNHNATANSKLEFSIPEYTIRNGIRWSVYHRYLRTAFYRPNLNILLNTRVQKINIEDNRAISVLIAADGSNRNNNAIYVNAKKEIILCAGAFKSPHLLKLSGIGPSHELAMYKIKTIQNSTNVGRNLYDQLYLPLFVSINDTISVTKVKILNLKTLFNYLFYGKGILSDFAVVGNINIVAENNYGISIFGTGAIDEKLLKHISNFKTRIFRSLFPLYFNESQEGFVLLSTCHQPKSRGSVLLKSRKTYRYPFIDPNYLQSSDDIKCMIKAIRFGVKIIKTKSFQNLNPIIHWPKFNECSNFGPFPMDFITNYPSDSYLKCYLRTVAITAHHPGGTCSIGKNLDSPLDNRFRVRGVNGLRVIDGSSLPAPITGTPNSVIAAIAEYGAEIILNDTNTDVYYN